MEYRTATPIDSQLTLRTDLDDPFSERLAFLLKANAEAAGLKKKYPTFADEAEARSMRHPLTYEKAFAYFGAMLGSMPPMAFFSLMLFSKGIQRTEWLLVTLMLLTTAGATIVGYFSGHLIGKAVRSIGSYSFSARLILLFFLGAAWGIAAGGAGGVFMFIIGAIFGAAIGGMVGAVALPLFSIPFFMMQKAGSIDLRHFLPISVGIAFSISAFILGFLHR